MTPSEARDGVVIPALKKIGKHTLLAEKLVMGTAAVESNFVNFVQFGGGPARGMFQMEPDTFLDIVNRVLEKKRFAAEKIAVQALAQNNPPTFSELTSNHLLAAALARVKYQTVPKDIPDTLTGQSQYWWEHYNGKSLHGLKPADYETSWKTFCASLYVVRV